MPNNTVIYIFNSLIRLSILFFILYLIFTNFGTFLMILGIFVLLISFLIYRFNSSAKEVELKSEATSIAVEEIEKVKQDGFEKYDGMNKDTKEDKNGNSLENQKVENKYKLSM